jgi:LCP family protein required for cell wall assembly
VDYSEGNSVSRTDTIILTTFIPSKPYVGLLSIPRDLWVDIPGYGQNRINTAHFFAEAAQAGSGPQAAINTIRANFGVDVDYYLRIHFEGFRDVVNAMGGLDVNLPEPMNGYPAGPVHLTGNKALAFARNRTGSDDFFRMQHGQLLLKAILKQLTSPLAWFRLPAVAAAVLNSIDTNLPAWQWPRLGLALLRVGPTGMDNQTITREMATPFFTNEGANVLQPNWPNINPLLMQMFGQ